jgi:hypothetical protein
MKPRSEPRTGQTERIAALLESGDWSRVIGRQRLSPRQTQVAAGLGAGCV